MKVDDDILAPLDLESAWAPAIVVRQDRQIIRANSLAEGLFGYARGEMEGILVDRLVPEPVRNRHVHHMDLYFNQPRARQMGIGLQVNALRKDGKTFTAEIALSPLKFEGSAFAVAVIREVDLKSKWIEQSLEHTKRILDRLESRIRS